jgi:hypothetical protein
MQTKKIYNQALLLKVEELEERIAPSGMGNPGNNNPPFNNTNNPGNEGTGGSVSTGNGSGGGNPGNNNPGENNTNLPGNQPKD